ncbi:MAG: ABC transporter permease [Alphaproteobacteria bacterium]
MANPTHPVPRHIGVVNWIGVWSLYVKEVRRFMKVYSQTMVAPVITTLLFLAIFSLALGRGTMSVAGVSFAQFLAPGLVMMAMLQNAFANTSSSMMISKLQGNIVDILMPPMSPGELTFCYVTAGATRGIIVGLVTTLGMWVFVPITIHAPLYVLFHAVAASLMLSSLGLIGGIWADKFDHIAALTNFLVTPLSFLSGTFYTIDRLPPTWQMLAQINPFFHMIDGFRYGFIGHADSPPMVGVAVMLGVNVVLWWLCLHMFKTGYKLKA